MNIFESLENKYISWKVYLTPASGVPDDPEDMRTDRGDDRFRSAVELLGLVRMNWSTAFVATGVPITVHFARKVGGIMAELLDGDLKLFYRYYM